MDFIRRKDLIVTGLLLLLLFSYLSAAVSSSSAGKDTVEPLTVYATPFITSNISKFGLGMEGVSVDSTGTAFATAYSGGTSSGLGSIANPDGTVRQKLFFKDQTGCSSFNGLRFLPLSSELSERFVTRAIATDVKGHQLIQLLQGKKEQRVRATTFCGHESMQQPNDAAVATRSGRVYLSGGNFGKVTTQIGDGDLWLCAHEKPTSFFSSTGRQLDRVKATRLGLFGITNGIEVSPDEKTLYLSESFHKDGEVMANRIWKFAIDPDTGYVSNKTLFVDFQELDGTGWVDVDGIRADRDGNLFVSRNGPMDEPSVVKLSPAGKLLLRIKAPGIKETTNCDLGGINGTSLFMVGKCVDDPDKGCVNVWHGNSHPGRAWSELTSSVQGFQIES